MNESAPILIGVGQFTQRAEDPAKALPAVGIAAEAAQAALDDTGAASAVRDALDVLTVIRTFPDSTPRRDPGFGRAENPPGSVAQRIGTNPVRKIYSQVGGSTPQSMLNQFAEDVVNGTHEVVMICGAEAIASQKKAARMGIALDWQEDVGGDQEDLGIGDLMITMHELNHGIGIPVNSYPLYEQAIRKKLGHTVEEHLLYMGKLFAPFTETAANNPFALYGTQRTAEELATVGPENRWVGFPYPKHMNAQDGVDQGAAIILTSVGKAKQMGVPEDNWVYLHGCAQAAERGPTGNRYSYDHSPAMQLVAQEALKMAGKTADDIAAFDIYSCFPSAVECMVDALGLTIDDSRPFTLTGGLPFFGGPGNNYTTHGIAEVARYCRAHPGTFGMATGNGGVISKHAAGVYSTTPTEGPWERVDPKVHQAQIDALELPAFTETPDGKATIDTYSVAHSSKGPVMGIILGRLPDGTRFAANSPQDGAEELQRLMAEDCMGAGGTVVSKDGKNTFTLD